MNEGAPPGFYDHRGRLRAAGTRPAQLHACDDPDRSGPGPPLDPPPPCRKRLCVRCRRKFKQTAKRRFMCAPCYLLADGTRINGAQEKPGAPSKWS